MNIIAWDTAYCLYPRATLLDRVALVIHPLIPLDTPAVRKYAERGYRLFNAPHAYQRAQLAPVFFPDALRWVDDARGWAVPLSTAGLAPPPLSATSAPVARDPGRAQQLGALLGRRKRRAHGLLHANPRRLAVRVPLPRQELPQGGSPALRKRYLASEGVIVVSLILLSSRAKGVSSGSSWPATSATRNGGFRRRQTNGHSGHGALLSDNGPVSLLT
jgi:hypothetical protein